MNRNPSGNPIISSASEASQAPQSKGDSGEARRFESLAEKLVKVPKAEIDEQRQQPA